MATHLEESARTSFPMASQTSWFVPDVLGDSGGCSGERGQPSGSGSGARHDAVNVGTGVQFDSTPRSLEQVGYTLSISQRVANDLIITLGYYSRQTVGLR